MADLDPSAIQQAMTLMGGLGSKALQAVTGYDAAAGLFRNASGQFQNASGVASGAFQGAANKIASGAKGLAPQITKLGSTFQSLVSGPIPSAGAAMTAVGQAMGSGITAASEKAAAALSMLGPEGAAAGAAIEGLGAVASATVGTLASLMGTAVEMTEKARLLKDSFAGLAGGAKAGEELQASIRNLNLPFAASQVNSWAASLATVGVKGAALENQLKAIAAAQALGQTFQKAWGAGAEDFFAKMGMGGAATDKLMKEIVAGGRKGSATLQAMGLSADQLGGQAAVAKMSAEQLTAAVAAALQKRGAGALDDIANSWQMIGTRAQAGMRSLFSGITGAKGPVENFMKAVQSLFGEFNKGSVFINTIKPIFTAVFSTLFSWAETATRAIHKGFLLVMIGALTAYIAMRPILDRIREFMTSATMLQGAKIILIGLAIAAGLMALPFIIGAAAVVLFVAALGAIVTAAVYVVGFVAEAGAALVQWVAGAASAASDFVGGLVEGITSGVGAFVSAVQGLASQGLAAFTGIFKIASHSKVMKQHGRENIAGAAAAGVDQGAAKMDASMANLGADGAGTPGGGRGVTTVHVGQVVIQVGEREDAESLYTRFLELLQGTATEAPQPVGP